MKRNGIQRKTWNFQKNNNNNICLDETAVSARIISLDARWRQKLVSCPNYLIILFHLFDLWKAYSAVLMCVINRLKQIPNFFLLTAHKSVVARLAVSSSTFDSAIKPNLYKSYSQKSKNNNTKPFTVWGNFSFQTWLLNVNTSGVVVSVVQNGM